MIARTKTCLNGGEVAAPYRDGKWGEGGNAQGERRGRGIPSSPKFMLEGRGEYSCLEQPLGGCEVSLLQKEKGGRVRAGAASARGKGGKRRSPKTFLLPRWA